MSPNAFGQYVRQLRTALDMTQAALADRVGCALVTLKKLESGQRRPSRQIAVRLALALQIPPDDHPRFVRLARRRASPHLCANPYRGLAPFDEHDRELFFGRDSLTDTLTGQLRKIGRDGGPRFLAVIGPSGSGKSSLVRAGLLPDLRDGVLPGSEAWPIAVFTPGADPIASLDQALAQSSHSRKRSGRLLVIDQFEEVFTLCADESVHATFLQQVIDTATAADQTWVVITLRADFFDQPLRHRAFGTLLCAHAQYVLPLTPAEIERAVIGPAEVVGVAVESALVATLVAEVDARLGALPLLQYVLTELFEQRSGQPLTLQAYHALGGIAGAVSRRASTLYAELSTTEQRAMRQVLLRLVQPGDVQAATRRRVLRRELDSLPLPASLGPMLERFARYRLLTLDRDPYSGEATVEIAHEVLIDEWRTLRDWLDAHHRALHTHRQLTRVAAEWQDSGRERSFLASGVRLGQFTDLAQHADLALNAVEHDFVTASVANHEHELRDARERHARLQASLVHREALRLAAESNRLRLSYGSAELVALLALRSIELCYTPQGDEALMGALLLDLPLRYLRGHTARIYTVAWGPDGRTVATAGQDAVIRLWDATTGSEMRQLIGHAGVVRLVAFSADGTVLASLGDDRTVRVWHVPTSAALHQLKLPPAGPEEIALDIAPDGRRLLVGGEYPEVLLWDLETGEQLGSLPTGGSCTHFVRFLPDGRSCVVVSSSRTLQWDVQTGRVDLLLERPTLGRAALVVRDGALTLAGAVGARIELWDLATAAHVASGSGHSEVIEGMAADPSGARFATVSNDGTARIWDAATGREERRFAGHGNLVWAVAWSPDGTRLVTGGADGVACIWDTTGSQSDESLIQQTAPVHGVVYLPDGRSVITASGDRVLRLWDVAERREQRQFTGVAASQIHGSLACSPDGLLLASGSDDGTAYLWEIASARLVRTVQGHHGRIWGVAIARGNALLLTTGSDGTARLWDVASGALLATLQGHTDLVVGAAFTPDGRYAVTGSDDRTVRLWDVTDGREVQRLVDPNGPMMQVDAHPDGRHILTGSADGSVRLWDSQRSELVRSYVGHQGYIYSVICSADGRLALTCAADRTARLWDIATGQELRRLAGHTSVVFDAALSRDGTQIITASYDRTARLWQADYRRAAALLSSRLLRDFTPDERRMYGLALE